MLNSNPYEAPKSGDSNLRGRKPYRRLVFTTVCGVSLILLWLDIPFILRTIQIFDRSDLQFKMLRAACLAMLLISLGLVILSAHFANKERWRLLLLSACFVVIFSVAAHYLIAVNVL